VVASTEFTIAESGHRVGDYEIKGLIAEGGMGRVFLAERSSVQGFKKTVALKFLHPSVAQTSDAVRMFIDEAKLAAQLSHRNIAQVHDLGVVEDRYYIAIEYVSGANLAWLRDRSWSDGKSVPLSITLRVLRDVLQALHFAHTKKDEQGKPLGIIHRDVTPDNILLGVDGSVKVTDFGIARATGRSTRTVTGVLRGKLTYMSPEQAHASFVDARSDLFSLAIVGHELITGKRYYQGNEMEVLEQARAAQPQPLGPAGSTLEHIFLRSLAKEPAERYPDAASFAQAVESTGLTLASDSDVASWVMALSPPIPQQVMTFDFAPSGPGHSDEKTNARSPLAGRSARDDPGRARSLLSGLMLCVLVICGVLLVVAARVRSDPSAPSTRADSPMPAPMPPVDGPTPSSLLAPSSPPAARAAPTRELGFFSLLSTPWAEVTIDGRRSRSSPFWKMPLPPGPHRVGLTFSGSRKTMSFTIEIEPGRVTEKRVNEP
jgi:eukaryotic-like serine/threonine-protein kinase